MKEKLRCELNKLLLTNTNLLTKGKLLKIIEKITDGNLYKYRRGTKEDLENLINDKFVLSIPRNFNDPFEFISISMELKGIYEDKYVNENIPKLTKKIEDVFKVGCFADNYNEILMWSHYADSHKGFCIRYDINELFDKIGVLIPVEYNDKIIEESLSDVSCRAMFRKSTKWNYEGEWRMVESIESNEPYVLIDVPKPKAIFLGCNIDENEDPNIKVKLIEIAKKKNIEVYQSRISLYNYKLEFELL